MDELCKVSYSSWAGRWSIWCWCFSFRNRNPMLNFGGAKRITITDAPAKNVIRASFGCVLFFLCARSGHSKIAMLPPGKPAPSTIPGNTTRSKQKSRTTLLGTQKAGKRDTHAHRIQTNTPKPRTATPLAINWVLRASKYFYTAKVHKKWKLRFETAKFECIPYDYEEASWLVKNSSGKYLPKIIDLVSLRLLCPGVVARCVPFRPSFLAQPADSGPVSFQCWP